jgi:23S rRNA pseudouridine1911/1915/1917 synthase
MEGVQGIVRATVERRHSNSRLDGFLASVLKGVDGFSLFSREKVKKGVLDGLVSVNGETEPDPRRKLRFGDVVESHILPEERVLLPDLGMNPRVLFENEHIVVIDKPAGMKMHPVSWDEIGTVSNWVLSEYPEIFEVGEDPFRPGIVHRLDRNTSGIVVIARTDESFSALKDVFQNHRIDKTYLALLLGHVPEISGEISFPLAEKRGTLKRMAVKHPEAFLGDTREALTRYRLKERFEEYDLVEVMPETGRTHQIRVHFSAIGCPVLGDHLYGGKRMKGVTIPKRQLLHASRLSFTLFGEEYVFESPLPQDFSDFLLSIDGTKVSGYPGEASSLNT